MLLFYLIVTVNAVFGIFHEQSFIEIRPAENGEKMAFGYSMGFLKSGQLIIGAPYGGLDGQVYICPIEDVISKNASCHRANINIGALTEHSTRDNNIGQHYCLGASIAATNDYFVTCAPLWMSSYQKLHPRKSADITTSIYGTCFIYNSTAYRYEGIYEQYVRGTTKRNSFTGGVGWTMLVDESNDLILISKIFEGGQVNYISISNPLEPANSTEDSQKFTKHVKQFRNVGSSLASGTFSIYGVNQTIYAFTMQYKSMTNRIEFLRYSKKKILTLIKNVGIESETINAMFGWAMLGVDLNGDGYTELLVGAPAQCDDDEYYETGALHIYTGGDLETIGKVNRMRSILGTKIGSRFGNAIASTDIDGDNIPEVIVSAPYEDFGTGAVYVISGSELNRMLLKDKYFKSITLSQLVSTQRIQNTRFKSFGVTLQIITDVDNNGRDELAIGCPESSRAIMYRSISSAKVAVSAHLVGEQVVRIKSNNFTVRVKIDVSYPLKPRVVSGKIILENSIIGNGVQIREDQEMKIIDLSLKEANIIIDVDVDIDNYEPGSYMFTTSIKLNSDDTFKTRDFNETWVTISPENPSTSLEIERRCSGESCLPQLNMSLEWSGSKPYKLGSTSSETVTIRFKNHGNSSYAQTCAHLKVSGARIARIGCVSQDTIYKCLLPIPIRREAEHLIEMMFNMSESTNKDSSLMVDVKFYNNSCSLESEFQSLEFVVPFELDTEAVVLSGSSNNRTLADSEVIDTALQTFEDEHEYTIENNGSISWQEVRAVIKWSNTRIIEEYKILLTSARYKCDVYNATDEMTYTCMFNLDRQSAVKIIAIIEVSEKAVEKYVKGKTINVTSKLELYLLPSETKKELSLTTVIQYHKELSLGHNKFVIIIIAIIVAVLILALLIFVLWKFGFFNRNTKKKLIEEKKEDERRKSMKRPTETNTEDINVIEGNAETLDDDLEVIEEPLQAEPNTGDTSDQLSLICEAEIH